MQISPTPMRFSFTSPNLQSRFEACLFHNPGGQGGAWDVSTATLAWVDHIPYSDRPPFLVPKQTHPSPFILPRMLRLGCLFKGSLSQETQVAFPIKVLCGVAVLVIQLTRASSAWPPHQQATCFGMAQATTNRRATSRSFTADATWQSTHGSCIFLPPNPIMAILVHVILQSRRRFNESGPAAFNWPEQASG